MLFCLGVPILFGHTEIDHMDNIGGLRSWPPDKKVIRLDIPVDQIFFVNGLNS